MRRNIGQASVWTTAVLAQIAIVPGFDSDVVAGKHLPGGMEDTLAEGALVDGRVDRFPGLTTLMANRLPEPGRLAP